MNKDLTIVFSSYQSQNLLKEILKIINKYQVIVIENSCDNLIKQNLEKEFSNVDVIIPDKNLGLAKSYNLGIDKAQTKFVFLNNPDIKISNETIDDLLSCAKKIEKFGIISPTYKDEKIFKNYEIFKNSIENKSQIEKDFNLKEVDLIDNNFLINKHIIGDNRFDENFFLFFETFDFSLNLKRMGKKIFVSDTLKFHHAGSSSLPASYDFFVRKTRSFHFNWGKFYYYRKNYNYVYALKKIIPNLIKSIKKMLFSLLKLDFKNLLLGYLEFIGIVSAMFFFKSFYRPNNSLPHN